MNSSYKIYASQDYVKEQVEEASSYTDTMITNVVDSVPESLNTLGKLATAFQESQERINEKAEAQDLANHVSNVSNPHEVTTEQLGLVIENWTFTLADGAVITKGVVIG